MPKMSEYNKG